MAVFLSALIPPTQRRTLDELTDRLDFSVGDKSSKRSAFWIMLTLSGIIAVSGVVADSTATVIGAMIVAPLSTPILGIGLGIVTARGRLILHSVGYVLAGVVLVTLLGVVMSQLLPNPTNVLSNSQVLGRTSPTLVDLLAAIATGFAGAIAITRRDVGDVLPGVAIAISLVPPLGVVGVCLGSGAPSLALGAFVLFASNVVAMVITGVLVLTVASYGREAVAEAPEGQRHPARRAYLVLAVALVVVIVPMVINSLTSLWARQVATATTSWLEDGGATNAEVTGVSWSGQTVTVSVLAPGELPPVNTLQQTVDDLVPWSPEVVVIHTTGQRESAS
ncbi:TIGR00341 family protein [Gordonia sp. ABSL49_1]|uniref:TIGR00341 family protein n=1 Tax=unclassified Gordonia (in: high G+C Gram-positive bacteria) TaxID=2657482 RepID=UPI001F0D5B58|nr:TIGR00341 family protein [Gordonia sp. ABSL49_1]MCH5644577.1 TIGR00341 family protein [Gordonia sp. ABSL49_1]